VAGEFKPSAVKARLYPRDSKRRYSGLITRKTYRCMSAAFDLELALIHLIQLGQAV
jgi:hypothetical protein